MSVHLKRASWQCGVRCVECGVRRLGARPARLRHARHLVVAAVELVANERVGVLGLNGVRVVQCRGAERDVDAVLNRRLHVVVRALLVRHPALVRWNEAVLCRVLPFGASGGANRRILLREV